MEQAPSAVSASPELARSAPEQDSREPEQRQTCGITTSGPAPPFTDSQSGTQPKSPPPSKPPSPSTESRPHNAAAAVPAIAQHDSPAVNRLPPKLLVEQLSAAPATSTPSQVPAACQSSTPQPRRSNSHAPRESLRKSTKPPDDKESSPPTKAYCIRFTSVIVRQVNMRQPHAAESPRLALTGNPAINPTGIRITGRR